jgi:hypothetical protein
LTNILHVADGDERYSSPCARRCMKSINQNDGECLSDLYSYLLTRCALLLSLMIFAIRDNSSFTRIIHCITITYRRHIEQSYRPCQEPELVPSGRGSFRVLTSLCSRRSQTEDP